MLEINNLHEVIVKVNAGSGVVLKFESNEKCYSLTAYHNIEDSIDNRENIEIFNDANESYNIIGEPYCDKDKDIAILEIDYIEKIPIVYYAEDILPDDTITFMGYPDKAKGTRKRLNGQIIEWNSTKAAVNVCENIQGSLVIKEKTNEVIVGFSGSAVFKKIGQKLSFIGILKSLPEDNFDYKEIDCVPISSILKIIQNNNLGELKSIGGTKTEDDIISTTEWTKTIRKDERNLKDKLTDVCSEITEARINKYNRTVTLGKEEQNHHDERHISALKYIIFEECQDELIEFYEDNIDKENLSIQELREFLIKYIEKAKFIINDKKKTYTYPDLGDDFIKKIILDLIDECYLSFDKKGIYE